MSIPEVPADKCTVAERLGNWVRQIVMAPNSETELGAELAVSAGQSYERFVYHVPCGKPVFYEGLESQLVECSACGKRWLLRIVPEVVGTMTEWKTGDKVWAAGEEAQVLEHDAREGTYRVKLLTSNREVWMDAKLVFAKKPSSAP
jgi:hypothetical protein